MAVTPASLLSSLVSGALLTILAWVVIRNDFALKTAGRQIGFFLSVIVVRMLLPVEFDFTVTLSSRHILLRDALVILNMM